MNADTAALALLGVAEVPQVMSAFLPSPSTARAKGDDPEQIRWLRRGEIIGGGVSLTIAASISMLVSKTEGPGAWWIFAGSSVVLGIFLLEYERAIREGQRDGAQGHGY